MHLLAIHGGSDHISNQIVTMGDLCQQIKDIEGKVFMVNGIPRKLKQTGVWDLKQQDSSAGKMNSSSTQPDLYTNVSIRHLKNHANKEHSLEACPEIKFRTVEDLRDSLFAAINANDGSISNLNKVGKDHGNIINPPIYAFKNVNDNFPPLMHDNDGCGMHLIKVTRKITKKCDRKENDNSMNEQKIKLEQDISEVQDQLENVVDTIKLISEDFERIAEDSDESKERLKQVLFEAMRDFEALQATLKKLQSENLKTMGFFSFV